MFFVYFFPHYRVLISHFFSLFFIIFLSINSYSNLIIIIIISGSSNLNSLYYTLKKRGKIIIINIHTLQSWKLCLKFSVYLKQCKSRRISITYKYINIKRREKREDTIEALMYDNNNSIYSI